MALEIGKVSPTSLESQVRNKRDVHSVGLITTPSVLGKPGSTSSHLLDYGDLTPRHFKMVTSAIPLRTDLQELVLSIAAKNRLTLDKTKQLTTLVSGAETIIDAQRLIHESTIQAFNEEMKAAKRLIDEAISAGRYIPQEPVRHDRRALDGRNALPAASTLPTVEQASSSELEALFQRVNDIRPSLRRFAISNAKVPVQDVEDVISEAMLSTWRYANKRILTHLGDVELKNLMNQMVRSRAADFWRKTGGRKDSFECTEHPLLIPLSEIEQDGNFDDEFEGRSSRDARVLDYHEPGYADVEERDEKSRQSFKLKLALMSLSPKQRQVFILRTFFGLQKRNIVQVLNTNIAVIERQSADATINLKKILGPSQS